MTRFVRSACGLCMALWCGLSAAAADEADEYQVPLMEGKPYIHVLYEGRSVRIERVQDPDFELKGYYARTARKCPPFCIHAMDAAPGVATLGEVEMFEFMETQLRNGTGVLIDARTPEWFTKGTIPGSVNYPFTLFTKSADDPGWDDILPGFGVVPAQEEGVIEQTLETLGLAEEKMTFANRDFSQAKDLVLFCNGPACDQSPRAIKGLLGVGYPAEKLFYYRGGMQLWELWGLTTVVPGG